jgi:hypothetical protein
MNKLKAHLSLLSLLFLLIGCLENEVLNMRERFGKGRTSPVISTVAISNDQVIVNGQNLHNVTNAKVTGGVNHTFEIESKSSNQLVLNAKSALSFLAGQTLNLVISNAHAAATFPIIFELSTAGASNGDVLTFDGTNWVPAAPAPAATGPWTDNSGAPLFTNLNNMVQIGEGAATSTFSRNSTTFAGPLMTLKGRDTNAHGEAMIAFESGATGATAVTRSKMGINATGEVELTGGWWDNGSSTWIDYSAFTFLPSTQRLDVPHNLTAATLGIGTPAVPAYAVDIQAPSSAVTGKAYGIRAQQTLTATANSDELIGLYINPTFNDAGFSTTNYGLWVEDDVRVNGEIIVQNENGASRVVVSHSNPAGDPPSLLIGAGNNYGNPLAGDVLGLISFMDNTTYQRGAGIQAVAEENFTSTATGSNIEFLTSPVGTNAPTPRMSVRSDGDVDFYNSIHIGGGTTCSATGCVTSSDKRLKKNINSLDNSLEKILMLQGVSYDWRDEKKYNSRRQIGLIAQDLEKIFPELVTDGKNGYKAVSYSHLVAPLIEAFKAQHFQQEAKMAELRKENQEMKTRLERLERMLLKED